MRSEASCHQPASISLRSSADFKTSSAGRSIFATFPDGVITVASRSFPLKLLHSDRAAFNEPGGTSTRIRSGLYFWRARIESAFESQNVPLDSGDSPPETKTLVA